MRSPADMRVIQIDITNACIRKCSNCTRFCGHHKKPFFMDFETFKRAVDSLDGFKGTIGIMGGEPTLHPDFERMVKYLGEKYPKIEDNNMISPQTNYLDAIRDLELFNTTRVKHNSRVEGQICGPGLWSTLGEGYKRHYEIIQDNILYQVVNDHTNEIYHQPALITRKEIGIPDEEWLKLRDKCWVQNYWSATITPKGAFFCEVAGALDMLFDGPGGWPIEKDWWKRTPDMFGDQLHWCEECALACELFSRNANDEIDDVSPYFISKLEKVHSPKLKEGLVNVLSLEDGKLSDKNRPNGKIYGGGTTYVKSYFDKVSLEKNDLRKKTIWGIQFVNGDNDVENVDFNTHLFDKLIVCANPELKDMLVERFGNRDNCIIYEAGKKQLGELLYYVINNKKSANTYVMILEDGVSLHNTFRDRMDSLVINPGVLHYIRANETIDNEYGLIKPEKGMALLGVDAVSLRKMGFDRLLQVKCLDELMQYWDKCKIVKFKPDMERIAPTGQIIQGKRYAIIGAGRYFAAAEKKIRENGGVISAVIDQDETKWGQTIGQYSISGYEYLKDKRESFDFVMIASLYFYKSIKKRLLEMGFKESEISIL